MSEQFENSIRKRLQEAEPPFDPAAWDQMKKRLDNSSGRRPAFWWWIGALLLLLGAGGWWWFSQHQDENRTNPDNRISVTDSTPKEGAGVDKQVPAPDNVNENTSPQTAGDKSNIAQSADEPAGVSNTAGADNQAKKNAPPANAGVPTSDVNNQANKIASSTVGAPTSGVNNFPKNNAAQSNVKVSKPGVNNQLNKPAASTDAGAPASGVNNQVNKNASPANAGIPTSGVNNQANKIAPPTNPAIPTPDVNNQPNKNVSPANVGIPAPGVDNPPDISNAGTGTSTATTKKSSKRGFDAGITLGPDFNTTPSLKNGRIGFGGGLLIRYHINNRFYLSTGAAYTKKLYDARDKDYYSAYPTNYKKIAADCNVLDVPLNIHYTFLHRPKSSWSVMAGASSYFMLKEKYEYYTNSGGKYKREFNNENQHYFSVLNLGFSYERETPGRINWGLQPYVKVPLGGVGQGKVNLYSAGVSLQVTIGKK